MRNDGRGAKCAPQAGKGGLLAMRRRSFLAGTAGLAAGWSLGLGGAIAQEAPTEGGVLRLAQTADAQPRNILGSTAGNLSWRHQVFDSLAVLDDVTGRPVPVLATEWAFEDEGRTIVLQLRDDVRFHTGRPFTADDVVFTIEQVRVPANASQMAAIANTLTSIEATGSHEVTIRSDQPIAARIFDLFQLALIVDQETFAGLADGSEVVGTGPFKWVEWVPGASLVLEKNADYWMPGRPYLDGIEISVISDATAHANAIRGRVDFAMGITPRDGIAFRNDPGYELFESGGTIYPLGIDVTRAPFDNKALRQAIGYAIDRERIIAQVFSGVGDPSCLWWRGNEPGTTDELRSHYHYDPDRARALIAEAGAEGVDVPINIIGIPSVQAVFEIVQNNLREVGLNPRGATTDTAAFDQMQSAGDLGPVFQQVHALQGFSAATLVDALPALRDTNPSKFVPPRYRELKDALQAADEDTYPAALQDLAAFMLDEAFSHILLHTRALHIRTPSANGIAFTNVGFVLLSDAWLS